MMELLGSVLSKGHTTSLNDNNNSRRFPKTSTLRSVSISTAPTREDDSNVLTNKLFQKSDPTPKITLPTNTNINIEAWMKKFGTSADQKPLSKPTSTTETQAAKLEIPTEDASQIPSSWFGKILGASTKNQNSAPVESPKPEGSKEDSESEKPSWFGKVMSGASDAYGYLPFLEKTSSKLSKSENKLGENNNSEDLKMPKIEDKLKSGESGLEKDQLTDNAVRNCSIDRV